MTKKFRNKRIPKEFAEEISRMKVESHLPSEAEVMRALARKFKSRRFRIKRNDVIEWD